ncbi:MAG: HesA/MoeB/ThiF family protein, partial [Gemmataceae bacterium]
MAHTPMHILQVGVGSGGIAVLEALAPEPALTHYTLIDPDSYEPHNVERHLFPASAIGQLKVNLARDWLRERRPDLHIRTLPWDITAAEHQPALEELFSSATVIVGAIDNEPAKHHCDTLARRHRRPWTLGEVLSGGIGGWVHQLLPDGPCYGCIATHLQR